MYVYFSIYIYVCTKMYMYIYLYIYRYKHIYIFKYTHTYTPMHIGTNDEIKYTHTCELNWSSYT
jgi:hypothetical protein